MFNPAAFFSGPWPIAQRLQSMDRKLEFVSVPGGDDVTFVAGKEDKLGLRATVSSQPQTIVLK